MKTNKAINILILSAGRRVELIECFINASKRLGIESKVVASDCSIEAPGLYFAHAFELLPRFDHPSFIEELIYISNKHEVSLIIPTIDTGLSILAKEKNNIEINTKSIVLVSKYELIKLCQNKILTSQFFMDLGALTPKIITGSDLINSPFPKFVKPSSGSSSIGATIVNNYEELMFHLNKKADLIVQDYIKGEEFTVDVFLNFNSEIISIVPRLRMAVRAGEILNGRIKKDKLIMKKVKELLCGCEFIGPITIQLIRREERIFFIEINPRYGGGAPMSIKSGADTCEYLFKILQGKQLFYTENFRDNQLFLRFDSSISIPK